MGEEPYEIIPHKEIVDIRKQIQELKSKGSDADSKPLLESVNKLTQQMNSMMGLFKTAAEDMRMEEKDEHFVAKKMEPLSEKLDEIMEQNRTIAEGMVAVADMIRESLEKKESIISPKPEPEFRPPKPEPEFLPPQSKLPGFRDLGPMGNVPAPPPSEQMPRPMPKYIPPRPTPAMPSPGMPMLGPMPTSDFGPPVVRKPKKKKGLFGKLKK